MTAADGTTPIPFEIVVRKMTLDDFDAVTALQLECFPGMAPWLRGHIESQTKMFPEGQVVIEIDGEIVASSCSLIVDFTEYDEWHNWKEIADSGYIRNHDYDGDTMYGIEIMVSPRHRGMKLARRLYEVRKQIAREFNLKRIIIGGRIPGYGTYADEMSARDYVEEVMSKRLFDPVLTVQASNGFQLVRLIPDYFPTDSESRGYATFLEWPNIEHLPANARTRQMRRTMPVRICVVQYLMRPIDDFEDFASQCEHFVDVASDNKSDFVVFPELLTAQVMSIVKAKRPAEAARGLAAYTPQYLELFTGLAVKYNVNIIGGSQLVVEEDEELYNVGWLFRRNGTRESQYKLHISPNEAWWWGVAPGSKLQVFDTDRGKIAILVGYDVQFPELCRVVAAKGANIVFVPFSAEERYAYLRVRHCAQARAIENQLYVAISGGTGTIPFVDNADLHYAQSGIFTPSDFPFSRDAIASECPPNIENVIIQDLDLELIRRNRLDGTERPFTQRRSDLYRVQYVTPDGQVEQV
ncbi:MAG: GNAT family N-acetyltransferase [Deltaproteobacteria bacterium]|jgi:predicted amidohydrolase/ribosomal protein S18 acetylase RimI-like enzyme